MLSLKANIFLLLVMSVSSLSQAREWDAHDVSLRASIEKIRGKEAKIGELIQEKNHPKNPDGQKAILDELAKEYKDLEKLYSEFETEKRHVRFEHPEQGLKTERKYRAYRIKSLEEYESEGGVEGRLNEVKLKVLNKYGSSLEEPKEVETKKIEKVSPAPGNQKKVDPEEKKQKVVELPPYKEKPKSGKTAKTGPKSEKSTPVKSLNTPTDNDRSEEKPPERIKLSF